MKARAQITEEVRRKEEQTGLGDGLEKKVKESLLISLVPLTEAGVQRRSSLGEKDEEFNLKAAWA